ncbi:Mitochondrial uncoupling protein 4 [Willisornis vidua]|uniref:Mitochondrial uncoupling protein 4 n=1 Tax=Willisornis vidua TaxID=1566151 RepID=A0ABQ9DD30_9PASS|nr:Mitochondrial uncoupling protein 4 [Willisornis vidua]
MLRTAAGIVREEGLGKLWQGATPAVYRHIGDYQLMMGQVWVLPSVANSILDVTSRNGRPKNCLLLLFPTVYSGVRMVAYEHLRDSVLRRAEDKTFPLWKAVVGGMSAGAIGQFFASPTDLVKVQMQMEGKRKLEGKPLRFQGVHHAFLKILSEGGIRGLWAGWVPNVQRAALVNMGDLTTYDSVKHFLLLNTSLVDNSVTHSASSACSGLVAAVLGTPADVVKTRIMNQPRDKQGRLHGHWYSGSHMNKSEGSVESVLFKIFNIHETEENQKAEFSFHKAVGSYV